MSDPQLIILPRRQRGGRPRASEPKTSVCAWLPASDHDRLIRIAESEAVSVSKYVGEIVQKHLRQQEASRKA
jgi:hypothetical protein